MTATCPAVTIWLDVPPHGVRLACALPAGHDGDHGAAVVETLKEDE